MSLRISALFVAAIVSFSIATNSKADLVTFSFAGTINSSTNDPLGCLVSGNDFTGTLTFDTDTPDTEPDPIQGDYPQSAPDTLTLDFSGCNLSFQNVIIRVVNQSPMDGGDSFSYETFPPLIGGIVSTLNLFDGEGTVFPDPMMDSLPTTPPPLSAFSDPDTDSNSFTLSGDDGEQAFEFNGQLTELTPEPGSLALLASVIGLAISRRRHTRG